MSEVAQVTHSSPDGHIPQLRFPQFSHDWAISTIGNLAKIDTGNRDTQDRVNSGKYPFYVRSNTVERINEYAFDGEAILTSGDGVGVGKNFHYVVGKFNYHQRVYSIHNFTNSTNGKFIYYYFADKFYRRVSRLSAKNSVDSVRMSMISDMPISIPAKPEQQKIAAFLSAVDNKIEQLSKKQELLGEYKKGLMQQIFSQAIRFKADDGSDFPDWEEKRLGGCILENQKSQIQVNFVSDNTERDDVNIYPFFTSGNKALFTDSPIVEGDNIFLSTGGIATINFYSGKGSYSTDVFCISSVSENTRFIYYYLLSILIKIDRKLFYGSGLKHLDKKAFRKIITTLPALPEQTKIANFLSSVDSKIEQVGKQLDESKQFKKALLQRMFV